MLANEAEKQAGKLVDWQLENNIELKKQGCWKVQLKYGRQAILQAVKEKRYLAKAQIELQLSSSEFFLGNYSESLELAESAEAFAKQHSRWREYIESLYLKSGVYRGLGNDEAIIYGKRALVMLEQHRVDDNFLRAKILYNLGAAYCESASSEKDLNKAEQSFRKAFQLFSRQNNHYEMVRVGLRLARVEYLRQNYINALVEIETIENHINGPRSKMLYHYQLAKVLLAMGKRQAAGVEAEKALDLADRLHATVDKTRIAKLLEKAEYFQPSPGTQ
ncbi:hypothetical protein EOPP23_04575 [Endozoicomonas sp. OPT23]|nr:hypothetical protein [Endozoicomonas sp. OPT23]